MRLKSSWINIKIVLLLFLFYYQGHDHTLSSIQYSLTGDQLITCGRDQTIKIWEVTTGYCLNTLLGHNDWVKCLSISLDGELLASGSHDQTIFIWKLSTGLKLQVRITRKIKSVFWKTMPIIFNSQLCINWYLLYFSLTFLWLFVYFF